MGKPWKNPPECGYSWSTGSGYSPKTSHVCGEMPHHGGRHVCKMCGETK